MESSLLCFIYVCIYITAFPGTVFGSIKHTALQESSRSCWLVDLTQHSQVQCFCLHMFRNIPLRVRLFIYSSLVSAVYRAMRAILEKASSGLILYSMPSTVTCTPLRRRPTLVFKPWGLHHPQRSGEIDRDIRNARTMPVPVLFVPKCSNAND
jgi:hypothetical protein